MFHSVISHNSTGTTASERIEKLLAGAAADEVVKKLDDTYKFFSHTFVEGKFVELSLFAIFVSAINHSDLLGLVFLLINIWVFRNTNDRRKCRRQWLKIAGFFLVSVFAQYIASERKRARL